MIAFFATQRIEDGGHRVAAEEAPEVCGIVDSRHHESHHEEDEDVVQRGTVNQTAATFTAVMKQRADPDSAVRRRSIDARSVRVDPRTARRAASLRP